MTCTKSVKNGEKKERFHSLLALNKAAANVLIRVNDVVLVLSLRGTTSRSAAQPGPSTLSNKDDACREKQQKPSGHWRSAEDLQGQSSVESCGRWTAADGVRGSDWNKPPVARPPRTFFFLLKEAECGGKVFLPPVVSQQTMLADPSRWQEETSASARQRCKRSGVSQRGNSKDDAKTVPSAVRTCQHSLLSQLPFLFSCQF